MVESGKIVANKHIDPFAVMQVSALVGIALCVFLIFFLSFPIKTFASQPIIVTINERQLQMDVPPVVRDGRTLVPFRAIFDALDAAPHWDPATRQISAYRSVRGESRAVVLNIGSRTAWMSNSIYNITKGHGVEIVLEVPPVLMGGRTMVPLRFVAEIFGAKVTWCPIKRAVGITTETSIPLVTQPSVPSTPQRQRLSSREVTARVQPAVVRIETHRGQGSGFFVSPDGLILTNAHVVRGSRQLTIITHAGERFTATLTKIANWHDLALLQINAPSHLRFPYLMDNATREIPQGEEVLAFGSPLGLAGTVTRGIVSAWQQIDLSFGAWSNNAIRVIQHDAAIAPGNSGGPLVNPYGEWVGVNTLLRTDWAGFGFAVPAERFHALMKHGTYKLIDDWASYFTEAFNWRKKIRDVYSAYMDAYRLPLGSREQTTLLYQSLAMAYALLNESSIYHPIYPEIQGLHNLWLAKIDASIRFNEFFVAANTGRIVWSSTWTDTLLDNLNKANNAYETEWRRIDTLFR